MRKSHTNGCGRSLTKKMTRLNLPCDIPVEFVFSKQAIGYEGRNPPRERFRSAKRTDRGAIFEQRYLHDILCDWKNNGHTSEPE